MNIEEIKNMLNKTIPKDERQKLLDILTEEYPEITIQEAIEMGFSYTEILFG